MSEPNKFDVERLFDLPGLDLGESAAERHARCPAGHCEAAISAVVGDGVEAAVIALREECEALDAARASVEPWPDEDTPAEDRRREALGVARLTAL